MVQKKIADQIYFSPGGGAEAGLEMVLMWSQVDAAGSQEQSVRTNQELARVAG